MQFKNILVFRVGHLGDTLVALPAFWAVKSAFPGARLTLLTNADAKNPHYISSRSVLPETGLFDEWLAYPSNQSNVRMAAALVRLSITLRARKFDAVFYLMTRNRTSEQIDRDVRYFRLSGIDKFVGFEHLKQNSLGVVLAKPTPVVERESDFLLNCLEHDAIPINRSRLRADLSLTDTEITSASSWLANETAYRGKRIIGIAPGSKWTSKIWPETHYGEVVSLLIAKFNVFPVVFGGSEDRETGDRLIAQWQAGANAAGKLGIREAAALLERCDIYVGNDTGTMHLAAAVGTPCVAIFAAIDAIGRWEPYGGSNHTFRKTVECDGCQSAICFNDHQCLNLVTPDEVYGACEQLLA